MPKLWARHSTESDNRVYLRNEIQTIAGANCEEKVESRDFENIFYRCGILRADNFTENKLKNNEDRNQAVPEMSADYGERTRRYLPRLPDQKKRNNRQT